MMTIDGFELLSSGYLSVVTKEQITLVNPYNVASFENISGNYGCINTNMIWVPLEWGVYRLKFETPISDILANPPHFYANSVALFTPKGAYTPDQPDMDIVQTYPISMLSITEDYVELCAYNWFLVFPYEGVGSGAWSPSCWFSLIRPKMTAPQKILTVSQRSK